MRFARDQDHLQLGQKLRQTKFWGGWRPGPHSPNSWAVVLSKLAPIVYLLWFYSTIVYVFLLSLVGYDIMEPKALQAQGLTCLEVLVALQEGNCEPSSLVDSDILWEDLQLGEEIGQGSDVFVYHRLWNGSNVAIKVFYGKDHNEGTLLDYKKEICIGRKLRHPKCLALDGSMLYITGNYRRFAPANSVMGGIDIDLNAPYVEENEMPCEQPALITTNHSVEANFVNVNEDGTHGHGITHFETPSRKSTDNVVKEDY
uniref:Uncharacterized protein n=1 Tax=Chenopodium quinoa TaxID=63459 RepID=A0A803L1M0_CHEQI